MPRWKKTYWTVWTANLITAIGMMSFLPFFPGHLRELGLQDEGEIALWSGLIFGGAPFAAAFMGPVWGSVGDRFGRKLMVLRALIAIAIFVGAMAFVTEPWMLFCLRLGQGVFSGFVPPSITLVSVAAPADIQGRVVGSLQTALPAGAILGPLLGELVRSEWGTSAVFLVVSVAAVSSAFLVAFFAHEEAEHRNSEPSGRRGLGQLFDDLRVALSQRSMRGVLLLVFCLQFGIGSTTPLLELYVGEFTLDPEDVPRLTAWLFTGMSVVHMVGMPLWGRLGDRIGHSSALLRAGGLTAVVLVLHGWVAGYVALFVARLFLGATSAGSNASSFALATSESPVERRGGAVAVVFSARLFAVSLGSFSGGWFARELSIRSLYWSAGAILALVVLGFGAQLRRARAAPQA